LVSEAPINLTEDYTTTGAVALERLIGTNAAPITIKLHARPNDGDRVWVKRTDAQITLEGNGNTIDGETEWVLATKYDDVMVEWSDDADEWLIMNKISVPLNDAGEVIISDGRTHEGILALETQMKLLNDRFEEAFETLITDEDIA
jgi:hypothetical protein